MVLYVVILLSEKNVKTMLPVQHQSAGVVKMFINVFNKVEL